MRNHHKVHPHTAQPSWSGKRAGARTTQERASPKGGWPFLIAALLCGLGCAGASLISHHEGQVADASMDEAMKTAPSIVGTPMGQMSDWQGGPDSTTPPFWRGTNLSLRWTQIGMDLHTPVIAGETTPWGGWFAGKPGERVTLTVSAVEATRPLQRKVAGSRGASNYTVYGTGPQPSSVDLTVDSGPVTVLHNLDGSVTLGAPEVDGQPQALWVWATTATDRDTHPWVTQVRVGALPYPIVQHAKALAHESDERQSVRLLAGIVAFLMGVGVLAFGWTALDRR